ncbi:universal stress protein [Pseudonocardia bannensis]|uniref:Universal stress protein n=1 Tax=Pseudonocardia bannensis TaxID=630973 RepID=A0A848DSC8_9PSEU|nr:universal stress protein [Pseudonocardia bannensis]NMH95413.1 universal stress protein [Pseudonocardia bannensis]
MLRGPVLVAFDGTPASRRALHESALVLAPRPAVVVVVWEAGRAFDLADIPSRAIEPGLAPIDLRTAVELDQALYEQARRLAEQGVALARKDGLDATGRVVADDRTVPDTLVEVASELDAQTLVLGAHGHGALSELLLGSTSRAVLRKAPCPVMIVRDKDHRGHGDRTRSG